jgi:ABC-type branched-subunit amino acid transport system ATPase component
VKAQLEISSLSKAFGGNAVLDRVDLEVAACAVSAVIGPNGAGKTTLFNAISGFVPPDRGRITLEGVELVGMPPHRIAELGVGRTFQNLRLFPRLTVLENVLVALDRTERRQSRRRRQVQARALLERAGVSASPDTFASDLSFAEQKFVSLARALACGHRILLLDEPGSGLDPPSLERMYALVRSLAAEGRTILLIEHNLDVVRELAERVVFLDRGRALARGTPAQVFASPEAANSYFGGEPEP